MLCNSNQLYEVSTAYSKINEKPILPAIQVYHDLSLGDIQICVFKANGMRNVNTRTCVISKCHSRFNKQLRYCCTFQYVKEKINFLYIKFLDLGSVEGLHILN